MLSRAAESQQARLVSKLIPTGNDYCVQTGRTVNAIHDAFHFRSLREMCNVAWNITNESIRLGLLIIAVQCVLS